MPNRPKPSKRQNIKTLPTDVERFFSWKGAFFVCLIMLVAFLVIPVAMYALEMPPILTVFLMSAIGSYGTIAVRYCYELKVGFTKGFWIGGTLLFIALFILSYLWVIQQFFI